MTAIHTADQIRARLDRGHAQRAAQDAAEKAEESFSATIVRIARQHERLADELHAAAALAGVGDDEADAMLVEEIDEVSVNFEGYANEDIHAVRAVIDAAGKLPIDQFNATPDLAAAINALYVHFESRIDDLDQNEKANA